MNPRIDQLVKSLLQKESLEQCSLPELEQFAEKNPYFGAAQLLLTKKLQAEHAEGFDQQLQKTLLYFHNPLWVEQWLQDAGEGKLIKNKKEAIAEPLQEEVPALPSPEDIHPDPQATASEIPLTTVGPDIIDTSAPLLVEQETITTTPVIEENIPAPETNVPAPVADIPAPVQADPLLENPALSEALHEPGSTELLFEPYHTVDYFASQGIKFKEEEKPKDKFGQQLKSFTEWLKTLKKIPATATSPENGPAIEEKVVKLAETSIQDREVYTEAMAEVWEKQGNRSKAIDIYSKLSLLEPDKSTYFAAKIEELKKQI